MATFFIQGNTLVFRSSMYTFRVDPKAFREDVRWHHITVQTHNAQHHDCCWKICLYHPRHILRTVSQPTIVSASSSFGLGRRFSHQRTTAFLAVPDVSVLTTAAIFPNIFLWPWGPKIGPFAFCMNGTGGPHSHIYRSMPQTPSGSMQ